LIAIFFAICRGEGAVGVKIEASKKPANDSRHFRKMYAPDFLDNSKQAELVFKNEQPSKKGSQEDNQDD
jgi:hypothetical protein